MKKSQLMRMYLVLLPLMALFMACRGDSVSVVVGSEVHNCSFFGTLPDGSYPFGLGLAAILMVVAAVVAVVYAVKMRVNWLKALMWIALASATLSVAPILLRTEPLALPNVGVTLVILIESLLSFIQIKRQEKEEKSISNLGV